MNMKNKAILTYLPILMVLLTLTGISYGLPALGSIQGTITNSSTGEPVGGVHVSIYSNNGFIKSTVTDSTGYYLILSISSGTRTLNASRSGYYASHQQVTIIANDTITVDISLNPIIPPGKGAVTGTVSDSSTGAPIKNATVSALKYSNYGSVVKSTSTDSNGNYILENLSEGSTKIVVSKYQYHPSHEIVEIIANDTITVNFSLDSVIIPGKGAVEGIVTESGSGEPILHAMIYAKTHTDSSVTNSVNSWSGYDNQYWTFTNSSGYYILKSLREGDYDITASRFGFEPGEQLVTIIANNTVNASFTLESKPSNKGSVQGTISDASTNDPIANAFVFVSIDADNWYRHLKHLWTRTDSTGFYQLDNIPAGTRTIKAIKHGYEVGSDEVEVISDDTVTLNIALVPIPPPEYGSIVGTVTDASTGLSIESAHVFIPYVHTISIGHWYNSLHALTDAEGNYSINSVLVGTRNVIAYKKGYHHEAQSVEIQTNSTSTADFELVPYGYNTGTIVVTVLDSANSQRISGATIFIPVTGEILPTTDWDNSWNTSNINGISQITGLPRGEQMIVVSKDGYDSEIVDTSLNTSTKYITVSLNRTGTTDVISWELYR